MIKLAILDSGINSCDKGITIFENEKGGVTYLKHSYDFDVLTHGDVVYQSLCGIENVEYFSVKIFHTELYTSANVLCSAIEWCISSGIDIINISAGLAISSEEDVEKLKEVCQKAYESNIIIVSAYDKTYSLPSTFNTVIGVKMDTNLLPGQYKRCSDGLYSMNGEVQYVNKAQKSRGGINGSSFACAKLTKVILNLMDKNQSFSLKNVVALLNEYLKYGTQDDAQELAVGESAFFFLNNTNLEYFKYPEIVDYNIKTIYKIPIFGKGDFENTEYDIIEIDLYDVFKFSQKFQDTLLNIDTVVVSNLTFLKDSIEDFEEKFFDLFRNLSNLKKNVISFSRFPNEIIEKTSNIFRKNNTFIVFPYEIRSATSKMLNIDYTNKTLLLSTTRVLDSIKLVSYLKKKNENAVILSTDENAKIIGVKTISELYNNQYYNYTIRKSIIKSNIVKFMENINSKDVLLNIDYPIMQLKLDDKRNQDYLSFIALVLAFECDNIILIANPHDAVSDIINIVNSIELIAARKISEIYISDESFCEQDTTGYALYSSLPIDKSSAVSLKKKLKELIPEAKISLI